MLQTFSDSQIFNPLFCTYGYLNSYRPLKIEILLSNKNIFNPYLSGNTLRLRYKAQPVNAIYIFVTMVY
jgi:hypothetical protein